MSKPIHEINRTHTRVVATTWCLVDPYRRGVMSDCVPGFVPTCRECARAKAKWEQEQGLTGQCRGSGASTGGTQGASGRRRYAPCPVCGRRIAVRPGHDGRLYPHTATKGGTK